MTEKTDHPPVPPGCEHFRLHPDWGYVFHVEHPMRQFNGDDMPYWVIDLPGHNRDEFEPSALRIIAAVAEVAWLREAERLADAHGVDVCGSCEAEYGASYGEHYRHVAPALANARAWREWGEANAEGR